MTHIKSILIAAYLLAIAPLKSQVIKGIEVETDPVYYFNRGYSCDIAVATERMLFRVLPYQFDIPTLFQGGNKDFRVTLKGVSADVDYFLRKQTKGWFAGIIASYTKDQLVNDLNNQSLKNDHLTLGARLGYRWFPFFKHFHRDDNGREHRFFVTPFVAPLFNITNDVNFSDGRTYKYSPFAVFGGVHIGWKFNFKKSKLVN